MNQTDGVLYLCATPIGNLEDISYRAVRILKEVALVAAEDTRRTRILFDHYQIKTPMISYHKFNTRQRIPILVEKLKEGLDLAVVSDAGLPGISDPGSELVLEAIGSGIRIIPIPGPSALTTALVASGLPTEQFIFYGFLPSKKSARQKVLLQTAKETKTLIFYEAPHRLLGVLEEMLNAYGDREACVAREITKKFEEFKRAKLSALVDFYRGKVAKGEITLLVSGVDPQKNQLVDQNQLIAGVEELIGAGVSKKEALKLVAKGAGVSKRELYNYFEKRKKGEPSF